MKYPHLYNNFFFYKFLNTPLHSITIQLNKTKNYFNIIGLFTGNFVAINLLILIINTSIDHISRHNDIFKLFFLFMYYFYINIECMYIYNV